MQAQQMVYDMYKEALTAADLKAICGSRGFSPEEVSSPGLFEIVFFSEKGLQSALGSLSRDETILLHVINLANRVHNVTVFDALYGNPDRRSNTWNYETFNVLYRDVFKKARSELVRKGVMLLAEEKKRLKKTTKLERWRFSFPVEFEKYLPSPFDPLSVQDIRGEPGEDLFRSKLRGLVQGKTSRIQGESTKYDIKLVKGKLHSGKQFTLASPEKWRLDSWKRSIEWNKKSIRIRTLGAHPLDVVIHAFSLLRQDEWLLPGELAPFWHIIYHEGKGPENREICEQGWKWGYLSKHNAGGKTYYRPIMDSEEKCTRPEEFLKVSGNRPVRIDIETSPYEDLEILTRISKMKVVDSQLEASPDLIAIGHVPDSVRHHPRTMWLEKNSSLFRKVLKKADKNRGKHIIHERLMIARVNDLSLVVKITRAFPDPRHLVTLSNDFIAFPCGLREEIRKLVRGTGHVVKTVKEEKKRAKKKRMRWDMWRD